MVHNLAMASASRLKSSMILNRRTHVLRADLRCGDIGAAVLGSLADRSGIEFVYQLCSYLPLIRLLTTLLPNIESTAHTQVR